MSSSLLYIAGSMSLSIAWLVRFSETVAAPARVRVSANLKADILISLRTCMLYVYVIGS